MDNEIRLDIRRLPLYGKIIRNVNMNLKKGGFPFSMQQLLTDSHTRWETVHTDHKTEQILINHGVILIFNHPYELETIATVASLPNRDDIYI